MPYGDRTEINMLANRLREMRKEKRLTLEELAEKLGTSRQTMSPPSWAASPRATARPAVR